MKMNKQRTDPNRTLWGKRIGSWNVDGLNSRKVTCLKHLLHELKPDIFALIESKSEAPPLMEHYHCFTVPCPTDPQRGGIILYARCNSGALLIRKLSTEKTQWVDVGLKNCLIRTCYVSPTASARDIEKVLSSFDCCCDSGLIIGDLNARSTILGDRVGNTRGRTLLTETNNRRLTILSSRTPTFHSSQGDSILDVAISKNLITSELSAIPIPKDWPDLSYHCPITAVIANSRPSGWDLMRLNDHTRNAAFNYYHENFGKVLSEIGFATDSTEACQTLINTLLHPFRRARRNSKLLTSPCLPIKKPGITELRRLSQIRDVNPLLEIPTSPTTTTYERSLQTIFTTKKSTGTAISVDAFLASLEETSGNRRIRLGTPEHLDARTSSIEMAEILPEVLEVVKTLSPRKSPGPDRITNAMLRICPEIVSLWIVAVWIRARSEGSLPRQWLRGEVRPIPKNNTKKRSSPDAYRPIVLLSCCRKVLEKVLLSRFLRHYTPTGRQFGFRSGRSTSQALRLAHAHLSSAPGVMAALDLKSAFDKADKLQIRDRITQELHQQPWEENTLASQLSLFLDSTQLRVSSGTRLSLGYIWQEKGVAQGGVLSPTFFNLIMDSLYRTTLNECISSQISVLDFDVVLYADDVLILTRTWKALQCCLNACTRWAETERMTWSASKCVYISHGEPMNQEFRVNNGLSPAQLAGEQINFQADSIRYLGCFFNWKGLDAEKTINGRMQKFNKAFWWLLHDNSFSWSRLSPWQLRNHFLRYCYPTLIYGCELLSHEQRDRLFQALALRARELFRCQHCQIYVFLDLIRLPLLPGTTPGDRENLRHRISKAWSARSRRNFWVDLKEWCKLLTIADSWLLFRFITGSLPSMKCNSRRDEFWSEPPVLCALESMKRRANYFTLPAVRNLLKLGQRYDDRLGAE